MTMSGPSLSRRRALLGALSLCGCAGRLHARSAQMPPNRRDLTTAPAVALTPAEQERDSTFLLLAMALLFDAWGVDRSSPARLTVYAEIAPGRRFASYFGHNIGALLVDRNNSIICFALNRSVALNSTMAHAEARAVGAAIAFANAGRPNSTTPFWTFGSLLQGDRLYGTLEPCAQCAGIMNLANIVSAVYAQDDPGQRDIANVLYNLHSRPGEPGAPLPVRATFLPFWDMLTAAYRRFLEAAAPGSRTGLTSFLQTVEAYRIYTMAAHAFDTVEAKHPENAPMLREARAFRARWSKRLQDDPLGIAPGPLAPERCRSDPGAIARPNSPLGIPGCGPG